MTNFTISYLSVNIKWGRELFKDVELNTDEDPMVFKAQLYALTGVIPQRQKVMFKGTSLKDASWDGIKLSNVSITFLSIMYLVFGLGIGKLSY